MAARFFAVLASLFSQGLFGFEQAFTLPIAREVVIPK
jgi:hypothetical protein